MSIDPMELSGVRRGPLCAGEQVMLADAKGHRHTLLLEPGRIFHTTKGALAHDDIIGREQGIVVRTVGGLEFTVFRPMLHEYTVSMPREAAVVYPKDAAQILLWADVFPGARVLEAGVGSGALSLYLLRAIGPTGTLHSYERRAEFAQVAQGNVEEFLGRPHPGWTVSVGELTELIADEPVDRAVLDMLHPWDCVDAVAEQLVPGGLLCCYVTTTTQMSWTADQLRHHGGFTEPTITETTVRQWHAEGLSVRPGHGTSAHTGFLVTSRRMAPGVPAPVKRRRPAPGAYGPDYHGPLPRGLVPGQQEAGAGRGSEEPGWTPPAVRKALRRRGH